MNAKDFSAASVTEGLETSFIGRRAIYYSRLESTMDAARREARQGTPEGTVIIAGEQTRGRGRMKRPWLSPRGNIALSVVLYPDVSSLPYLIMLASLAAARSIEAVTGLKTQIKWPNDIIVNGKKVCGILIESEMKGGRVAHAVIGIGINVELSLSSAPDILACATSLAEEAGHMIPPVELVRRLLVEIERLYLSLPGGESIYKAWRDRLVTLGNTVYVASGDATLEGTAESADRDGALLLRQADGNLTRIVAGDVTLRDK